MPRSGGALKTGGESQQSAERVASSDHEDSSENEDDILETSENGRYQKMNEQVGTHREIKRD